MDYTNVVGSCFEMKAFLLMLVLDSCLLYVHWSFKLEMVPKSFNFYLLERCRNCTTDDSIKQRRPRQVLIPFREKLFAKSNYRHPLSR